MVYPCGFNQDGITPDGINCKYPHLKDAETLYGVKIIWDEDKDVRILCWLDSVFPSVRDSFFSVGEHKAWLDICLKPRSASGYIISNHEYHEQMILSAIGAEPNMVNVCGDSWLIEFSWAEDYKQKEYDNYIHSPLWKQRSHEFKKENNGRCKLCGVDTGIKGLRTHHIKYPKNFQDDKKENWIAICEVCHKKLHGVNL